MYYDIVQSTFSLYIVTGEYVGQQKLRDIKKVQINHHSLNELKAF